MATNFPSALDSLANPAPGDALPGHAAQHANANDAIEALQAAMGVTGSAVTASVEYRLSKLVDEIAPVAPATTAAYMFRSPVTLSSSTAYAVTECYISTETSGVFLGAFFCKRNRSNTAETLTDLGLFRAGLHTWHGSLTKSGSWVTLPSGVAAGAWQATGCPYSVTAGNTISGTVTGTAVAIRHFLTSNGGYGIVSIDGDWTKADKLPMFTSIDYDGGFCRLADVGKRYYTSYCSVPSSQIVCLSDNLTSGSHVITVEVTGTKPAASTEARVWVEAFVGCNGQTLGSANVYAVPVQWVYHDINSWSAFATVVSWAPAGSSDYQFMGDIHGDGTNSKEVTTSLSWSVDGVDQTAIASGTWVSGHIIRCDHKSTLAHKANLATVVANKTRIWTIQAGRKFPVMCDHTLSWLADGKCHIEYSVMLPIGEAISYSAGLKQDAFTSYKIGSYSSAIPSIDDNSVTTIPTDIRRIIVTGPKVSAWAARVSETPDRGGAYAGSSGLMQDRSSKDKKFYTVEVENDQPYLTGDQQRYVIGWGAKLL